MNARAQTYLQLVCAAQLCQLLAVLVVVLFRCLPIASAILILIIVLSILDCFRRILRGLGGQWSRRLRLQARLGAR